MENDLQARLLKLKALALGSRPETALPPPAGASYEGVVDCLLALHAECGQEGDLAKDANIARFVARYEDTVNVLKGLRLTADDFKVLSVIGRGHFGEVQVVSEKSTGNVYAMKIMKKTNILQQADAAFFAEERDIMAWGASRWLTRLHFAFHDASSLYLVMDYHPGGDLLTVMERRDSGMSEEHARFYLSEIAVGLNDLHSLGFLHRDVKPENVLIALSGHIKLVDFGSAARLGANGKVVQCRLPVGTPEYIAPEVLTTLDKSADYGVGCDWWSLGIIAYELVFDTTPFEDESTAKTYANIMNYKNFAIPSSSSEEGGGMELSAALKDLITSLLTTPEQRLSFTGITAHSFFSETHWDSLTAVAPPYVPTVSGASDTSNFETFEPQKDYSLRTGYHKRLGGARGFTGKDLPFVGFTYSQLPPSPTPPPPPSLTSENRADFKLESASTDASVHAELDELRKELGATKEQKASLEKECAIYQSQLEDCHRKLEIERAEWRHSDSQALELLQEVRQQSQTVHKLREKEASLSEEKLSAVVVQLETDRSQASRRARRLQEELKASEREKEEGKQKMAELLSQLGKLKKQWRKDIATLQERLAKVTTDAAAKVSAVEGRLLETQEKYVQLTSRLTEAEEGRKKAVVELEQIKLLAPSVGSVESQELSTKLAQTECARDEARGRVAQLEVELQAQAKTSDNHQRHCTTLKEQITEVEGQLQEAGSRLAEVEGSDRSLREELAAAREEAEGLKEEGRRLETAHQRTQQELDNATQQLNQHQNDVSKLAMAKQSLEGKVRELEQWREAVDAQPPVDEKLKALREEISALEGQKQATDGELELLRSQLAERDSTLQQVRTELSGAAKTHAEVTGGLRKELKEVKTQLNTATSTGLDLGERLREVRKDKRTLSQELAALQTTLSKMESQVHCADERSQKLERELKEAADLKEKLATCQREAKLLQDRNKECEQEVAGAQKDKEEEEEARREAQTALEDAKRTIEAKDLNAGLLKKSMEGLEEELQELKGATEEAQTQEAHWRAIKEAIASDLETAEERLDSLYTTTDKETNSRASAERLTEELMTSLEKATEAHSAEVGELQGLLATQKQLASKFSDRVAELEQSSRLQELALKQVRQELVVEKTVSSKLYDELQSVRLEHGKVKAAQLKLASEVSAKESCLAQATETVEEQRTTVKSHQLQETRLQATISQQSKLIDYLQTKGSTPSGGRLRKGLKLGRKSRDPAKEIAEWNKLKGMLSKSGKGSRQTPKTTLLPQASSQESLATPGSGRKQRDGRVGTEEMEKAACVDDVVSVAEEEKPVTVAGRKRRAGETGLSGGSATQGGSAMSHNIPHQFRHKANLFHKSYICGYCKGSIKQRTKFAKCHYCGLTCHQHCADSAPNTCGLPQALAEHVSPDLPSPKKPRTTATRDKKIEETSDESVKAELSFDGSTVIKSSKIYTSRGTHKVEGWLVLTKEALYFYNRDPKRAVRPFGTYPLSSPIVTTIVLPDTARDMIDLPSPGKLTKLAFTIEQYSKDSYEHTTFLADSHQDKTEWTAAIQSVLSAVDLEQSPQSPKQIRELKSVSIVPVHLSSGVKDKPESAANVTNTTTLDFSFSMLGDDTDSDSDSIV